MIWRWRIGPVRITFTIAPVTDVVGVNSRVEGDLHIPMWDFDKVPLDRVRFFLRHVQGFYMLPKIYILRSSPGDHYIAYCFKKLPWRQVVAIVASTPDVDWNFFKYGVYRGHFTLRVSPKNGHTPRLVEVLHSDQPEDVAVEDLVSWTRYETLRG